MRPVGNCAAWKWENARLCTQLEVVSVHGETAEMLRFLHSSGSHFLTVLTSSGQRPVKGVSR